MAPAESRGIGDLHSHLVPAVDDGACSLEAALDAVERMVEQGVRSIVTTPHLNASTTKVASDREARLAKGGGRLLDQVDHALVVPTESTAHAQEIHLAIGHSICDRVDRFFAEENR